MAEYVVEWGECVDDFTVREKIVRCKDCVHCREHNMRAYGGRRDQLLCHHFSMSSGAGWPVKPDGFCAWGEQEGATLSDLYGIWKEDA